LVGRGDFLTRNLPADEDPWHEVSEHQGGMIRDIRSWHLADVAVASAMSAFEGRADILKAKTNGPIYEYTP
jgi:hypothetical protein